MSASEPTTPDWDAIARYRAGECTPDEMLQMAHWLRRHPEDAALLEAMDAAFGAHLALPALAEPSIDVDAALHAVHQQMRPARRLRWSLGGLVAAAAVIGALMLTLPRGRPVVSARRDVAAMIAAGSAFRTAVGVRDSVRLSDGTRVLLAPGSRLTVASKYGAGRRDVSIAGAALFSVRHDAASPFVVHAGSAEIRDVGTEFVVRAPAEVIDAGGVAIVVTAGEVAVAARASATSATRLRAGDRAELATDGTIVAQRGAATADDIAWTRGVLVFHAARLDVVRDDLRRWYGIDLRIADSSLASRRLTAVFDHQPLEQVLSTIALALGAEVERDGAVATLRRAVAPR